MSFTSATFLIVFFPVSLLIYYVMRDKYKNMFLLVLSCAFYLWVGVRFFVIVLLLATTAYLAGIWMEKTQSERAKTRIVVLASTISILVLFYYKYLFNLLEFLSQNVRFAESGLAFNWKSPLLPLGVSFYTFSILSYVLDVYWGKCKAQHNILNLYLYVLFFPKVIQGPIMRYGDFEPQLHTRIMDLAAVDSGIRRFIIGMFKKVVIADQLQSIVAYTFGNIAHIGTIPAWIGIFSYLIQLYYDFSGYSDMAIGLAQMFGFKMPENFNHPYVSETVAEYWRRWHSSLGEWFRDYCYMPVFRFFNGKASLRKKILYCDLLALLFTWILTGIWHGSGLRFFLYGLWWFMFIAIERIRDNHKKKMRKLKKLAKQPDTVREKICNHCVTAVAIIIGQVIFRADTMQIAMSYLQRMFSWDTRDGYLYIAQLTNSVIFALVIGTIFAFPIAEMIKKRIWKYPVARLGYRIILVMVFFVSFAYSVSAGYSPFLYQVF